MRSNSIQSTRRHSAFGFAVLAALAPLELLAQTLRYQGHTQTTGERGAITVINPTKFDLVCSVFVNGSSQAVGSVSLRSGGSETLFFSTIGRTSGPPSPYAMRDVCRQDLARQNLDAKARQEQAAKEAARQQEQRRAQQQSAAAGRAARDAKQAEEAALREKGQRLWGQQPQENAKGYGNPTPSSSPTYSNPGNPNRFDQNTDTDRRLREQQQALRQQQLNSNIARGLQESQSQYLNQQYREGQGQMQSLNAKQRALEAELRNLEAQGR